MNCINPYKMFQGAFIPNAIMECKELSQSAKLMWARLAQYAGKNGRCYPKMETLAYDIGISKERARKIIMELKNKGFIKVKSPTGKQKLLHMPNEYFFIDHPAFSLKEKVDSGAVENDQSGAVENDQSLEGSKTTGPIQENHTRESNTRNAREATFEKFWSAYPKKKSKGDARKAWAKINLSKTPFSKIMKGLAQATRSTDWAEDGGKYIPYPATWLNGEGWEDEYEQAAGWTGPHKTEAEKRDLQERLRVLKEENNVRRTTGTQPRAYAS